MKKISHFILKLRNIHLNASLSTMVNFFAYAESFIQTAILEEQTDDAAVFVFSSFTPKLGTFFTKLLRIFAVFAKSGCLCHLASKARAQLFLHLVIFLDIFFEPAEFPL